MKKDNFKYKTWNEQVIITGLNKEVKNLVIPSEIQEKPVTKINSWAFWNNNLESVVIPESVTYIGHGAFRNNNLKSVIIPESVTFIGEGAFAYNNLESVVIPESVTKIGTWAFAHNKLESVIIPDSVNFIDSWAFAYNNLESVVIPEGVTYIGLGAFDSNVKLTQGSKIIRRVDGILTTILSTKKVGEYQISSAQWFNTGRPCYVAEKDGYSAHGKTTKKAIEDLEFKILSKTFDVDQVVDEVKSTEKLTLTQFRLLTGACKQGCEQFLKENGLGSITELPLKKAKKALKNAYGYERLQELIF